jgi:mxaJ protein
MPRRPWDRRVPTRKTAIAKRLTELTAFVLLAACGLAGVASGEDKPLRVCADPDNLPYSNRDQQGFENKIADVIAKDLGTSVEYFWWPHQRGLVRNTLSADQCDVLIGIPKGYDPVLWTKPYYRSAFVLVYRADRKLRLKSLDDPALKKLQIGVHLGSPGHDALANRDLAPQIHGYRLFFDPRDTDPSTRPQKVLEDVVAGTLDVAVAWGPLVGHFVSTHPDPPLEVVPLGDDPKTTLTFEFSMGVKKGERDLKARLEAALDHKGSEVRKILESYGVPLLPMKPPGESADDKRAPPGAHRHDPGNDLD